LLLEELPLSRVDNQIGMRGVLGSAEQSAEKNDGILALDPSEISDVSGLSLAIGISSCSKNEYGAVVRSIRFSPSRWLCLRVSNRVDKLPLSDH